GAAFSDSAGFGVPPPRESEAAPPPGALALEPPPSVNPPALPPPGPWERRLRTAPPATAPRWRAEGPIRTYRPLPRRHCSPPEPPPSDPVHSRPPTPHPPQPQRR